jgi:membrane protein
MAQAADSKARGREATRPTDIPKPGWRDIAMRVKDQLSEDNIDMVAAGVAFYMFFAIFPALLAALSIYGLFADPAQVAQQIQALTEYLPAQARDVIGEQLTRIADASGGALGWSAAISILVALWSATKGVKALMTAFNITYDETEKRGFFKFNFVAFVLTLFILVFGLVVLVIVAVIPALLAALNLDALTHWIVTLGRWPILFVLVMLILAFLYRFAPSRDEPRWRWATPGALLATVLWLIASLAFSIYVANFADYNATYGTLAAVVTLLFWFYITAYVVLLGAEVNCEMERQTRRDTTTGEEKPMGQRRAYAADTVAGETVAGEREK